MFTLCAGVLVFLYFWAKTYALAPTLRYGVALVVCVSLLFAGKWYAAAGAVAFLIGWMAGGVDKAGHEQFLRDAARNEQATTGDGQ